VPGWRARAKAIRDSEKERQEVDDDIENDGESETEGEEDSEDNSDDFEEDLEDDNIEESEEDYEDEESDDDDIDVGSHIGLVLDDEEVFGVIVEFDDDEGLVTIEEDGTGDLVTGYQDSMFIED
jgi:ribonuclease E